MTNIFNDNERAVAQLIKQEMVTVKPLAIAVKDFNVKGLDESDVAVALERLKERGVVKDYHHCFGFFVKTKTGKKFEETDDSEPLFTNDLPSHARLELESFAVTADAKRLSEYLKSKPSSPQKSHEFLIERRGEDFYCNNKRLKFTTHTSLHYLLMDIIYGKDGGGRFMTYADLDVELVRRGAKRIEDAKKVIQRIRNAVNNGVYFRVDKSLRKYVQVREREGIVFHNPPKQ